MVLFREVTEKAPRDRLCSKVPTPPGEDDEEDMVFSLSLEEGCKIIVIKYGAW